MPWTKSIVVFSVRGGCGVQVSLKWTWNAFIVLDWPGILKEGEAYVPWLEEREGATLYSSS